MAVSWPKVGLLLLLFSFVWYALSRLNMETLVESLVRRKVLVTDEVIRVFRSVDRRHFLEATHTASTAYTDAPQPIGYHVTISAPHMVSTRLYQILTRSYMYVCMYVYMTFSMRPPSNSCFLICDGRALVLWMWAPALAI